MSSEQPADTSKAGKWKNKPRGWAKKRKQPLTHLTYSLLVTWSRTHMLHLMHSHLCTPHISLTTYSHVTSHVSTSHTWSTTHPLCSHLYTLHNTCCHHYPYTSHIYTAITYTLTQSPIPTRFSHTVTHSTQSHLFHTHLHTSHHTQSPAPSHCHLRLYTPHTSTILYISDCVCLCEEKCDISVSSVAAVQFRGKKRPRKRIRKYILDLAGDQSQPFGQKVGVFITEMRARSMEPHQKMLLEVRMRSKEVVMEG